MEAMTVRELLEATGGVSLGGFSHWEKTVTSVETDSRAIHPGALFVALRGERTDGHRYIATALESGAAGCLTEEVPETLDNDKFYIKVPDTMVAIGQVARAYKARFPIPVVGITGSVGKTTTKDMVASVLGAKYRVLKTEGNFNNELGLPLTLFRLSRKDEICVLEMGMNHFGEIDYLTSLVCPDVAVMTNIGDSHIENLGSRENILKAKSEIFHYMKPGSLAVLNGDDPLLRGLEGKITPSIIFCGADHHPPYQAKSIQQLGAQGMKCTVHTPERAFEVTVPALGSHMIYPVLISCVIGEHFGLNEEELIRGIHAFVPTKMRMNVLHQGEVTILDDAYNANPQSMGAALEVLSQSGGTKRVAILGDMFELGSLGPELHYSVGEYAGNVGNIDVLLAVGELARNIYEGAKASHVPAVYYAKDKAEAKALLPQLIQPGAVVLAKASRGMAFEELVREVRRLAPEG
ncbi:MAG: UDP-N-acetylmuramoyl-tripeptide--D-alanyl-D-alanine ligase [Ruminiclostridium sp.]|nr:UDP-N-acetylmuramoyl-tripeptide--D-alanyl-D-alanine ligase [Ruminiclostridium sp.]